MTTNGGFSRLDVWTRAKMKKVDFYGQTHLFMTDFYYNTCTHYYYYWYRGSNSNSGAASKQGGAGGGEDDRPTPMAGGWSLDAT